MRGALLPPRSVRKPCGLSTQWQLVLAVVVVVPRGPDAWHTGIVSYHLSIVLYVQKQACDVLRLPSHILVFILQQLHQEQLFGTIPLVCKVWRHAAQQAAQSIQLNLAPLVLSPMRQLHLPQMLLWLQRNSQQLQQLNLSTSTPLGWTSRRALLRCLAAKHSSMMLQLRQLTLQLDLDNQDLEFLAQHICTHAPRLKSLKLQPVKPSLADLQLMVLACILGNLVGIDALGEIHIPAVSRAHLL